MSSLLRPRNGNAQFIQADRQTKLVRQQGRTNLAPNGTENTDLKNHRIPLGGIKIPIERSNISLPEVQSNFEVYCDSPSPKASKHGERRVPVKEEAEDKKQNDVDNNIIHQIERRVAEKQAQPREKAKAKRVSRIPLANRQGNTQIQNSSLAILERLPLPSVFSNNRSYDEVSSCATSVYEDACSSIYGSALESQSRSSTPSEHRGSREEDEKEERTPVACEATQTNKSVATIVVPEVNDVLFCSKDFTEDVFKYMRTRELLNRPHCDYMTKQKDITADMRCILIEWLADVCGEYNLQLETFCKTTYIIDRYLSKRVVDRMKLQLVGTAALMIASKCEEIYPPELKDCEYVTDNTYTGDQIKKMEMMVLNTLHFEINQPSSSWFAERLIHLAKLSTRAETLVAYLIELSLSDVKYVDFLPSQIGSAAICATRILTAAPDPWDDEMARKSGLGAEEIMPCVRALLTSFRHAPHAEHNGIYQKYTEPARFEVSNMPCPSDMLDF